MVVGHEVIEAELFHRLGVCPQACGLRADLRLREDDPESHRTRMLLRRAWCAPASYPRSRGVTCSCASYDVERELGQAAGAVARRAQPDVVCLQETKLADELFAGLLGADLAAAA